jgi:fibronectin type 3 domain-containing protein
MRIFTFLTLFSFFLTAWGAQPAPSQVTGVTATQGTLLQRVTLSWSSAPRATAYDVYRSTAYGTKGSALASNLTVLTFDDITNNATHYFYTLVAKNASGASPDSVQVEGWGNIVSPVNTLTATQGTVIDAVHLTWSPIVNATGYNIYRATSSGGALSLLGSTVTTSYNDASSGFGTAYYYKATAIVGGVEGPLGNEATGWGQQPTPSQVSGVSASQGVYYDKVTVSWSSSTGALAYDVYRSITAGSKSNTVAIDLTGNSYDDTATTVSTHYFYTVVAKNATGNSPDSTQSEGWIKVPGTISTLSATKGTVLNAVDLSWLPVADATSYNVYRASSSGGALTLIGSATTPTFTDSTSGFSAAYYYRTTAIVGTIEGPQSNEAVGWGKQPVPDQVTGVTASQGAYYEKVSIAWSVAANASSYDIFRSSTAGDKGSLIASNLAALSYDDTSATGGSPFFYIVVAKNAAGYAPDSSQSEGWGKIPGTVGGLSATQGTVVNAVTLSWSATPDATRYNIYRASSSGGSLTLVANSTVPGFTDSTTGFGSAFYYKISVMVGAVEGSASVEVAGWGKQPVPDQVTGVSASQATYYDKVLVSWASTTNADTYDVYRSSNSGTRGSIIASDLSVLTYDDTTATGGTHYFYTIVAKNGTGSSPDSSQVDGWGKLPTTINALSASQGTVINAVELTWSPVADATSYKIYRAPSSGGTLTLIGNSSTPNFTDSTSSFGLAFYYKVSAMVDMVEGPKSNEVVGWGQQPAPLQVTGVTATQDTFYDKVKVSWSFSINAASFDLYRSTAFGAKGYLIASGLSILTYDDTAAMGGGTHYFYTVVAKNATGSSPDSTQAEGWGKLPATINTLTATQGTVINAVQLSWLAVPDATSYKVYRANSSGGALTLVSTSLAASYTDSTSGFGNAFYYKVTALVGTVEGPVGNEAAGWGKQPAPVQVTGVTASQGTYYDKVTVSWSSSTGALAYDVYRSSTAGTKGNTVATDLTGNSYDDGTATGGAHYFYTIVAKNGTGSSPDSSQAEGWGKLPATVNTLSATQGTLTAKVKLTWVGLPDATGYEIYRATSSGGTGSLIATVGTTTSYDDNNALPGSAFYYTVKTKVSSLVGPAGNEAAGWSKQPAPISTLTASLGTVTSAISLSWTADPEASSYEVWRSTSSGGSASLIGNPTSSNFVDSTTQGVAYYYYTVKTKVGGAVGPVGNEAKGFANAAPTSASVTLATTSYVPSAETLPIVVDPNIDAGQGENLSFAITEQTTSGMVSISNGKFKYTPPVDGSFSGPLSFKFVVTDRGGQTFTANGSVNVSCTAPSISALSPTTPVLIATEFSSSITYSIPACSKTKQIDINILDNNNVSVSSTVLQNITTGIGNVALFNTKGLSKSGTFSVKAHIATDIGEDVKSAQLVVKPVNLPVMGILPSTSVIDGQDTIDVTLQNPSVVNCQFTSDKSTALADASKCLVELSTPPYGLTIDNSGALPSLHGIIQNSGQYTIDATVSKFNGQDLLVVGKVSKTIIASCPQSTINSFSTTSNLLPYIKPTYKFNYDALACNGALSANFVITANKDGSTVESRPITLTDFGSDLEYSLIGQGLSEGGYTANLSIQGAEGTATKTFAFNVKQTPLPSISISPSLIDQGETKISIGVVPSQDKNCPLTSTQSDAENDPRKCFVFFNYSVPGLQTVIDSNGLPSVIGYTSLSGSFDIGLNVSRWVDGQRYDLKPVTKTLVVRGYSIPVFAFSGATEMFTGVSKSDLELKQTDGTNCYLFLNYNDALKNAIAGKKSCLATFTIPSDLTPAVNLNSVQLNGTFATVGEKSISYSVSRIYADGMALQLGTGSHTVQVTEPPAPGMAFSGGSKIAEDKYFLQSGSAFTRLTVSTNPILSAKVKITSDDTVQPITRNNVTNGSSFWLATENLPLLQEREVKVRVAWMDYPSVFSEKLLKVVGGPQGTPKLHVEVPQTANSTDELVAKVKIGQYTAAGFVYDKTMLSDWKGQLFVETNNSARSPVSDVVDLVNGEAEFKLNPANKLFMKISASADIVSSIDGLHYPIQSPTKYVGIVNTAPLVGIIIAKQLEAPAPKVFTLDLDLSVDNKVALKETHWEESIDNGDTWQEIEALSPVRVRVSIGMRTPGRKLIRVKMASKTGIESYTTPVEVWAYSKLDVNIIGPSHVAPGYPVTIGAELYRDGKATAAAIYDWVVEYHDRAETTSGPTVTINDSTENKILISLRARPSDTNANDKYAWTIDRHVITTKIPSYPSVSASGPRDVEVGKTYHYVGTTRPSWGNVPSVHTIGSEWELPDGRIVTGNEVDWSPSQSDLVDPKPLKFRAWVNEFKESTIRESTVSYVPWEYVWPNFSVALKQLTVQAPADLFFIVSHDRPEMNRRFEDLKYEWIFPTNVNARQNEAFPNRAAGQAVYAGEYDITIKISDSRGNQTQLTQHVVAEPAVPYAPTIKVGKSNYYDRVPMTVTVRPTIYGGHPLDSVVGQIWKVDGLQIDDYTNRSYMVSTITEPGDHTISYTLNSKMGETATVSHSLHLVANQKPSCQLTAIPNAYVVYAEAKCTDADGKIVGYAWRVNDQPISATSYRISFGKTGTPQSAKATITAIDDAKDPSVPVSITIDY